MNQTKGFLFFGCFLLVAGLAFVLVFALRGHYGAPQYNCNLVQMEPRQNTSKLANRVSKDNTMIANFAGFIKFIHFEEMVERVSYLPLELIGIRYTKFSEHNLLVLETTCANLELIVLQNGRTTIIKQVLAFWHKPYRFYKHCYVQTHRLDTPAGTHYACQKQESYDCIHSTDTDIWDKIMLVANQLEFEVGGANFNLQRGQFSTNPVWCPV